MPLGNTNSLTLTEKSKLKHILGGITWKSEPIWVLAHTAAVLSGDGGSEEPVLSVSVYVWTGLQTKPQDGISLLLLPAAALQSKMCYSPEYRHCGWNSLRLCLPLCCSPFLSNVEAGTEPESCSVGLDRITVTKCTAAGTQDVGEKIRDSPRLPGEWKRAWWG